jgi:uncharacterized protein YPO0396
MDHAKIKTHLDRLAERIAEQDDRLDNQSYDLIRDLRTECDNQATKIVDLEEKADAIPEMVAVLEEAKKFVDAQREEALISFEITAIVGLQATIDAVLQKVKQP